MTGSSSPSVPGISRPRSGTQLAPGGRLVVPLRWRGQTRSIAFVRDGDHLVSDSVELCGFVPMIGHEHAGELTGPLDDTRPRLALLGRRPADRRRALRRGTRREQDRSVV